MNERISRDEKNSSSSSDFIVLCLCLFAVGTVADDIAFLSPIVGSNPGVTIAGCAERSCAVVVKHGFAVLNDEGRLRADLCGLILQNLGTPGPVTAVAASVVCGDAVAATTDSVPLSVDGNAEIHAKRHSASGSRANPVRLRARNSNKTRERR